MELCSLIDLATIKRLGLPYNPAMPTRSHGLYWEPGAQPKRYDGVVPGLVHLQFSKDVVLTLPEIKVIQHSETLIILGTDLQTAEEGPWHFRGVGFDHRWSRVLYFIKGHKTKPVDLVGWPQVAKAAKTAKRVSFADPPATVLPEEDTGVANGWCMHTRDIPPVKLSKQMLEPVPNKTPR